MRISSSPFVIVNQPTPGELALAVESPLAKAGGGQAGVQFGQPTGNTQGAPTGAEQTASSILALLLQGSGGAAA
ncbi:hypothetical protein, partial [Pseudomonas syringae]